MSGSAPPAWASGGGPLPRLLPSASRRARAHPTCTRQAGEAGEGGENTESRRLTQQSAGSVTGMKGCSVSEVAWPIKSQRIGRRDVALL